MTAILSVVCHEPEGARELFVYPLHFHAEELRKFYDQASKFPVLFGKKLDNMSDFLNYVLLENLSGEPEPAGLYWKILDKNDTYIGVFFMDHITHDEADVYYSFFDKRHRGREVLVKEMLRYIFHQFRFIRSNVSIPAYAGMGPRKFIERCGFKIEGRKRKACFWRGDRFDVHCYGILREEL